jgi:hypothetical protein
VDSVIHNNGVIMKMADRGDLQLNVGSEPLGGGGHILYTLRKIFFLW